MRDYLPSAFASAARTLRDVLLSSGPISRATARNASYISGAAAISAASTARCSDAVPTEPIRRSPAMMEYLAGSASVPGSSTISHGPGVCLLSFMTHLPDALCASISRVPATSHNPKPLCGVSPRTRRGSSGRGLVRVERVLTDTRHTVHARAKPDRVRPVAVRATEATEYEFILHRFGTRGANGRVRITCRTVSIGAARVEPAHRSCRI